MVWGLCLPDGFGDGWPDGSFESDPRVSDCGWHERLKGHYLEQDLDVQRKLFGGERDEYATSYPGYVTRKFVNEAGSRASLSKPPYSKIEKHEAPEFFHTLRGHSHLCSLVKLNSFIPAVDEDLKSMIEALEPGVHQFYPIEMRMPAKKVYPKQYYTLVIGTFLESFDFDQTRKGSAFSPHPGKYNLDTTKKAMSGAALRKTGFGGHHLWRERTFWPEILCFSNDLHNAIIDAELKMPRKFHQMAEV